MRSVFCYRHSFFGFAVGIGLVLLMPFASIANAGGIAAFELKLGAIANYGASPWYTDELAAGVSPMKFNFDSGANFMWATSDECKTDACNAHQKVNTTQPGFVWIDKTITPHSFGPWGTMCTKTGKVTFNSAKTPALPLPFFASVKYEGSKFRYLVWDGGIGFPSESSQVEQGSDFYFGSLYASGAIAKPIFSVITDPKSQKGFFYMGGEDPAQFDVSSKIELRPKKNTDMYLWGTNLYGAQLGKEEFPTLSGATFYLDTGSSVFKGDSVYLTPILVALLKLVDKNNKPIFEPIFDDNLCKKMIGLVYAGTGNPSMYKDILPSFTLTMGQSCRGVSGQAAKISLNAEQYSFLVREGDYKDRWVVAFTVLDGVGGFLVGSVFMDYFYTTFEYNADADKKLTQGNMYLYTKKIGEGPAALSCVAVPPPASPITGIWYNSYCSQVDFKTTPSGEIRGVYTSHTGSTGSSDVVGWLGKPAAAVVSGSGLSNPYGTPVALGIQWRLIDQNVSDMDNSWHWVSTFSGQYFPAQVVSLKGQKGYYVDETLELLNGLEATATLKGLADIAPIMWPQTLLFTRKAADYCVAIKPLDPLPFQATADDHVTGKWTDPKGNTLNLTVNMKGDADTPQGSVTGTYTVKATNEQYTVTGLIDAIKGNLPEVVEQGVTLAMVSKKSQAVMSMAGGVSLKDVNRMDLWRDTLTSANWSGRFAGSALDKTVWTKIK